MLVSRPIGLLALLDEESRFPRATDRSLVGKFYFISFNISLFKHILNIFLIYRKISLQY